MFTRSRGVKKKKSNLVTHKYNMQRWQLVCPSLCDLRISNSRGTRNEEKEFEVTQTARRIEKKSESGVWHGNRQDLRIAVLVGGEESIMLLTSGLGVKATDSVREWGCWLVASWRRKQRFVYSMRWVYESQVDEAFLIHSLTRTSNEFMVGYPKDDSLQIFQVF